MWDIVRNLGSIQLVLITKPFSHEIMNYEQQQHYAQRGMMQNHHQLQHQFQRQQQQQQHQQHFQHHQQQLQQIQQQQNQQQKQMQQQQQQQQQWLRRGQLGGITVAGVDEVEKTVQSEAIDTRLRPVSVFEFSESVLDNYSHQCEMLSVSISPQFQSMLF